MIILRFVLFCPFGIFFGDFPDLSFALCRSNKRAYKDITERVRETKTEFIREKTKGQQLKGKIVS